MGATWRTGLAALAAGLLACSAFAAAPERGPQGEPAHFGRLEARAWRSASTTSHPHLVVVLHGDLAGVRDDYQYRFASTAGAALDDTVVVAILRPGYADTHGAKSEGRHGLTTGDNYTPEVIASLATAIAAARTRYSARDVTLVGHSGGAAIAADLVEADPKIASRLLLVSCPCDLVSWRNHMAREKLNPLWLLPVRSVSPDRGVTSLRPPLHLSMIVGARDDVAPPALTKGFADRARAAGVQTRVSILPGAGHDILLDRRVLAELVSLQAGS